MKGTCSIEGCNKEHYAKGFCKNHYTNYLRCGNPLGERIEIRKSKIGVKNNRLTVVDSYDNGYVLCECECCNRKMITYQSLIEGRIKSCGCIQREKVDLSRYNGINSKYKEICEEYVNGRLTMQEVADRHGITRQRVHQILNYCYTS